jgi:hypothetical protein
MPGCRWYLEWAVDAERLTMDGFRKAVLPS